MTGRVVRAGLAFALAATLVACGTSGGDEAGDDGTDRPAASDDPANDPSSDVPSSDVPSTDEGRGDPIDDDPASPTDEVTTVTDPVNAAFTVDIPVGWDSLVYSQVDGQIHREVVNAVSPDGGTVLFLSDPKLPTYWNPDTADPVTVQFAEWLESMDLAYYEPAPAYFEDYVHEKFGGLDDFAVESVETNQTTQQQLIDQFANAGITEVRDIQVADVRFTFTDAEGTPTEGLVTGSTIDSGSFWQVEVVGLATDGSVDEFVPMLTKMASSKKTRQEFIDLQNQRHQQTMDMIQQRTEEMTRQHERNMQWIQDSANAHQQRMEAIWAANDASISSWYDRMQSSDIEHRQFLNYINEESTVQTTSGQKFQVDNSYQRYWLNPDNGQYVGGDVNFDESDIRDLGLNPNDYQEVEVVKG